MRRKTKAPIDDRPMPWEPRPVSRERWLKHREWLMADNGAGVRPEEWWLYEQGREQPENQTQVLYAMGELQGDELAKCMGWWRNAYADAIENTPQDRQGYLDFHNVPREIVQQWDAERAKGGA